MNVSNEKTESVKSEERETQFSLVLEICLTSKCIYGPLIIRRQYWKHITRYNLYMIIIPTYMNIWQLHKDCKW